MNYVGVAILCVISAGIGFFFGFMYGAIKVRVYYDALKHKYELLRTDHQAVLNKVGNLYNEISTPPVEEENRS
jgi:hypothetical protein